MDKISLNIMYLTNAHDKVTFVRIPTKHSVNKKGESNLLTIS